MITRGEQWGVPTTRTHADIVVNGDRDLASRPKDIRLIVKAGDIARSLGDPVNPLIGAECIEVPIDALRVNISLRDGSSVSLLASSHVMIGHWLRGRFICVNNSGFIGKRNISPRAHPNDGFFDVMSLQPSMRLQQRVLARHRSALGTHVPHPLVDSSRAKEIEYSSVSRSESLHIDGRRIPSWSAVRIEIVPDYWRLLV
jgi:hypothetical protein